MQIYIRKLNNLNLDVQKEYEKSSPKYQDHLLKSVFGFDLYLLQKWNCKLNIHMYNIRHKQNVCKSASKYWYCSLCSYRPE